MLNLNYVQSVMGEHRMGGRAVRGRSEKASLKWGTTADS